MKKKILSIFCFTGILLCLATFFLPMQSACGCLSNREILEGTFNAPGATNPSLARAIKKQMEGVNLKKARVEWEREDKEKDITKKMGFAFCSPRYPWKNDQSVSCLYGDKWNLFKRTGWQLDFKITPQGNISDVQLSSLTWWLGIVTLHPIPPSEF